MSLRSDVPDGWRLVNLPQIDGTNAEMLRRASTGEPEGLAIRADLQTSGRGRRGRSWSSPAGNLYLSVLIEAAPKIAGEAGFTAALALIDAINSEVGRDSPELRCKWPNDLLWDGAKVAGLLLEAVPGRDQVVIGMGVNLIEVEVADALYPIGSLAGFNLNPEALAVGVCRSLAHWVETWRTVGFAPLRRAWLERASGLGQPIAVQLPRDRFEGTFQGLAENGALLLDQGRAGIRTISAGDVFFGPGT
jgi:BirA family transcriptional regulator, biotin operon repressor / biotin---[acetyl-CoA-carboxylase] ligase